MFHLGEKSFQEAVIQRTDLEIVTYNLGLRQKLRPRSLEPSHNEASTLVLVVHLSIIAFRTDSSPVPALAHKEKHWTKDSGETVSNPASDRCYNGDNLLAPPSLSFLHA